MIHIWSEDSYSGAIIQFLQFLKMNKVNNKLINADIRGFNGNDKLCLYVEECEHNKEYSHADEYYLFFDDVWNNNKVIDYRDRIDAVCELHDNVKRIKLLSFEYLILKFVYFVQWTEPVQNYKLYSAAKIARTEFISCVENKIDWRRNATIVKFIVAVKRAVNNLKLAVFLLFNTLLITY